MPVWNTATGEFLAYDDDFSFFDYQSGSPEAIPDMAYSQPASEPLSRFGSSNGSSNPSNPDPHFLSSINEPLYDQGQHEASMGQVGSSTSYWGYDDSADRFDALGSQFKPVSASSSFSSSPSFGNLHVHNPAYASGYDFSGVSQSHYDLPDVSQYFQSPNAASQALFSLSGPLDTFQETVVTQAASEDQVARTPRHHRR